MLLEVPGYGVFAVIDGIPVAFPDLVSYAAAKAASPNVPVLRVDRTVGEPLVQNMLLKTAKAIG